MRAILAALIIATTLIGCDMLPTAPGHGVSLLNPRVIASPPEIMRAWHDEVASCMGQPDADFTRLLIIAADGITGAGSEHGGAWRFPHDIILRAELFPMASQFPPQDPRWQRETDGVRWWDAAAWTFKHELVHDFLGGGSHSHPAFTRCAPFTS